MAAPKWLQNVGHILKVIFTNKVTLTAAAGVADTLLPGFSPLINSAATAIITSEATATAAGMQNGTGVQKMAYATALFQDTYNQWAAKNNLSQGPTHVENVLQAVFNLLDAFQVSVTASTPVDKTIISTPTVQEIPVPVSAPVDSATQPAS